MRKQLLITLSVVASAVAASAQVTIDGSTIAPLNSLAVEGRDNSPAGNLVPGPAGSNQTWNLSGLVESQRDSTLIVDPETLPFNGFFPTANRGLVNVSDDSTWLFMDRSANALLVLGAAGLEANGDTVALGFDVPLITFPSTMGTTYSESGDPIVLVTLDALGLDPDGAGPHPALDSIRVLANRATDSEMDGWGTLQTPLGTFNVVRQHAFDIAVEEWQMLVAGSATWETISAEVGVVIMEDPLQRDTQEVYRWWTDDPNHGFPVATLEMGPGNVVAAGTWLRAPLSAADGISPLPGIAPVSVSTIGPASKVQVYPNPTTGRLFIEVGQEKAQSLEVSDITGKHVATFPLNGRNTVDVAAWAPGMYFYRIRDVAGRMIAADKLVLKR
ncbi:MAG: T9SS type A sorting domain-containing protein [Bacteroidota bacterium]